MASRPLLDTLLRDGAISSLTTTDTLEDFANNLYGLVNTLRPGVVTSLLRIDRTGVLHPVGSSGLPPAYDQAVDGLAIGEGVGVCGTAAHRREPVLAHKHPDDPLWAVLAECGLPAKYGTCWSTPIFSATEDVVGTFAFYYPGRAWPSATDQAIVDVCADLCRLALERDRLGRDVTESRTVDPVTGLLFYDPSDGGAPDWAQPAGVMVVEVDNHAAVSHALGFAEGDRLLAESACGIQQVLDRRLSLLQRMRGPQFRVVVPETTQREMSRLAHQVTRIGWGTTPGGSIDSSMTVGAATGPEDGEDVHSLTRAALLALAEARSERPGTVLFFHSSMGRDAARRLELGAALRTAIDERLITLAYQPQVDLKDGSLVGAEVLARWNHGDDRMPISPALFVGIAEEIGLSRSLDQLVFEQACAQLRAWDDAGIHVPRLSVNFSPVTLTSPALVQCATQIIDEFGVDPERLTVEVIESRLVEERTGGRTLENLHAMGMRISLDDFGTGYSAFGQLARLPIDEVKIDRSFVAEDTKGGADAPIATAILQIAQTFGQEVVAEGIESPLQRELLRQKGCPIGQGYLFSKPLTADAFAAWATRAAA